jgi:hypothetical protein
MCLVMNNSTLVDLYFFIELISMRMVHWTSIALDSKSISTIPSLNLFSYFPFQMN